MKRSLGPPWVTHLPKIWQTRIKAAALIQNLEASCCLNEHDEPLVTRAALLQFGETIVQS